ncbi:hypothetical protein FB451DRAFT_1223214 [Mycena latifolia]|nr:hypothetical protein FB451DRAFT_1223214 [Mycena latifolia]
MSSTNDRQPPQGIMTSPVFRYAVLIVMCVVVIMGAGVCYRTRVYQRRMRHFAVTNGLPATPSAAHDWGPPPSLFDVYLDPPSDKRESEWGDIMPISITRGGFDARGTSSIAVMINMPFSPFTPPGPLPNDGRYLPHLDIGLSDVDVRLTHEEALRSSSESAGSKKKGS